MDVLKYICVLLAVFLGGGDTGGHGGSHHDHVKLHVPEFIHHDHHTKVITIHHHHHKPKEKHYHHHHHHHHKPPAPYGHHYHKHHKQSHTKTQTSTLGHGQEQNSHRGQPGYHGRHVNSGHRAPSGLGHQIHTHKHHDTPSFNYEPNPVTFDDDYKSFVPSVSASIPQAPQVYGVQHTVKQVKVFDSLPGALPGNTGSHGYEVTEEGEQSEDDAFTAINTLPQTYPATFGFVRNAGVDPAQNDILADFPVHSSLQTSHDPFASGPEPTSYDNIETFSTGHADPFASLAPAQEISPGVSSSQFPLNDEANAFDDPPNVYSGDITGTALISPEDALSDDTPVSFSREAGIQETVKTGGVETVLY